MIHTIDTIDLKEEITCLKHKLHLKKLPFMRIELIFLPWKGKVLTFRRKRLSWVRRIWTFKCLYQKQVPYRFGDNSKVYWKKQDSNLCKKFLIDLQSTTFNHSVILSYKKKLYKTKKVITNFKQKLYFWSYYYKLSI